MARHQPNGGGTDLWVQPFQEISEVVLHSKDKEHA